MLNLKLPPQIFYRALPALLLPLGVFVANFGWTPPDGDYVGDLTTWVIFAFLLGVGMWHQDRINQSYSTHWIFLPVVGLYNGFTFGLAVVLVLAGSTTPDGAIVLFFVTGTLWGVYVVQKISVYADGVPLEQTLLKKTFSRLLLTCIAFVVTALGFIDAGLGGALGFQFLVLLPLYETMQIDPREERIRKALFTTGALFLIAHEFFG